ncbi:hypothetical protein ACFQ6E_41250 [Streptomyces sp. NPDC056462]|uniref:hypothetical protein n=1 Tax=Streptomyces sp. NPDC056462 TaxID=3345826 RepID=UPI0036CFAE96
MSISDAFDTAVARFADRNRDFLQRMIRQLREDLGLQTVRKLELFHYVDLGMQLDKCTWQYNARFPMEDWRRIAQDTFSKCGFQFDLGRLDIHVVDFGGVRNKVYAVDAPEHIVVILDLPQGGVQAYRHIFHELGHALHYSHFGPTEYRMLRNPDLMERHFTEGIACLFESLIFERRWLRENVGLSGDEADKLRQAVIGAEALNTMWNITLARFEIEMYRNPTAYSNGGMGRLLCSLLSETLGVEEDSPTVALNFAANMVVHQSVKGAVGWVLKMAVRDSLRYHHHDGIIYKDDLAGRLRPIMSGGHRSWIDFFHLIDCEFNFDSMARYWRSAFPEGELS